MKKKGFISAYLKHQKKLKVLQHPLLVCVINGFIISVVGVGLTAYFTRANLDKQIRLALYKDMITQQSAFVDHFSKDLYNRMYKLSAFFDSMKDGDAERIKDWHQKYRQATDEWNEELLLYSVSFDRYFPKSKCQIGKHVIATELFKEFPDYSFREVLEKVVQVRFATLNKELNVLYKSYLNGDKIDEQRLKAVDKDVDALYKRVYEMIQALSRASTCYELSLQTRLQRERF